MIGAEIGNFRVVRQLGVGGMGEVYLAEQKNILTKVAIKTLLPHISSNREHVQRFFNEAVAVSRIKHAGIVKIFDVGFLPSGQAYLVMEFLDGETLSSRIHRAGRLPLAQLADIGRQIAGVLDATQQAGITHRDLKPDNVFLVPDAELESGERVKVLDFGIAKLGGTSALTSTSVAGMGTPGYMAPEQWHNSKSVDWRADAYSLGCVMFEMAAGRLPFLAESIAEACTKHLTMPPPALRSLVPELPVALDALVAALLEKEPARRPASFKDIARQLAQLGQAQQGALAATVVASSTTPVATGARAPGTTLGTASGAAEPATARSSAPVVAVLAAVGVLVVGLIVTAIVVLRGSTRAAGDTRAAAAGSAAAVTAPPRVAAAVVPPDAPPRRPRRTRPCRRPRAPDPRPPRSGRSQRRAARAACDRPLHDRPLLDRHPSPRHHLRSPYVTRYRACWMTTPVRAARSSRRSRERCRAEVPRGARTARCPSHSIAR